jgi:TetR/AcrR family transcriptional repressor of nem operon
MSKGELSKEYILESSVEIFNTNGYVGTSLQHVMDKTGFTKGGIYRHFDSKEDLAAQVFKLAYSKMKTAYTSCYADEDPADVKLIKFLSQIKLLLAKPPVKGGCPILNSATEVDDTNERLRKMVKEAAADWEDLMNRIFQEGIASKLFAKDLDYVKETRFIMAAIEGAILFCRLHKKIDFGLQTTDILIERIRHLKQ